GYHRALARCRVNDVERRAGELGEEDHPAHRLHLAERRPRFAVGSEGLTTPRLELILQPRRDAPVLAVDRNAAAPDLRCRAHRRVHPAVGRRDDSDRIVRLVAEIELEGANARFLDDLRDLVYVLLTLDPEMEPEVDVRVLLSHS